MLELVSKKSKSGTNAFDTNRNGRIIRQGISPLLSFRNLRNPLSVVTNQNASGSTSSSDQASTKNLWSSDESLKNDKELRVGTEMTVPGSS